MPEIINNKAENYAASFTSPTDELLKEIEDYTMSNHPQSNMLSGPVQGNYCRL